jgi:hypothetical protein
MTLRMPGTERRFIRRRGTGAWMLGLLMLAGCAGEVTYEEPTYGRTEAHNKQILNNSGSVFDGMGLPLVGRNDQKEGPGGGGIGVNSFLWRATLDTVSFMPLASADPFGGVIITDWYSPPESPGERFKMTVFILDRQLRADGLKVSVFRQQASGRGDWQDVAVAQETATDLENAILTRARQLRADLAPR